jgi:hypothetical protein
MRSRIIKTLYSGRLWRAAECSSGQFPGFLGAGGRRNEDIIGSKGMGHHICPDHTGIFAPTISQFARAIFRAWFGTFGLGMTK